MAVRRSRTFRKSAHAAYDTRRSTPSRMRATLSRPLVQFGLVAGGYAAALAIAAAVVAVRVVESSGPVAQASSGMYAFGDLLTFLAVFGAASLVPTALGLFFLTRPRSSSPII